jgi:hypothetical protein
LYGTRSGSNSFGGFFATLGRGLTGDVERDVAGDDDRDVAGDDERDVFGDCMVTALTDIFELFRAAYGTGCLDAKRDERFVGSAAIDIIGVVVFFGRFGTAFEVTGGIVIAVAGTDSWTAFE